MNKFLFAVLFMLSANAVRAQSSPAPQIFDPVLATAQWAKFPYTSVLQEARDGQLAAVRKFLGFHAVVDGKEGVQHGITCLELIPLTGDTLFAQAASMAKPKLRQIVLERMQLAQMKTLQEALRRPLSEWAPLTQVALTTGKYDVPPPPAPTKPQTAVPLGDTKVDARN